MGPNVTQNRHASTAARNQRAASMRRIDAAQSADRAAVRELKDAPRHRRLAQQRDRRRLIGELEDQLEPDCLGDVEVRLSRCGPRARAGPSGCVAAAGESCARAAELRIGHPGRIADHQQWTRSRQVRSRVEVERQTGRRA